jgi:hypothetical protein
MPAHQRASLRDAEDHAGVTILDAAVCGTNHVSVNTYHEITTHKYYEPWHTIIHIRFTRCEPEHRDGAEHCRGR